MNVAVSKESESVQPLGEDHMQKTREDVRVLIVDDDEDIRTLIRIMLTLNGFAVVAEATDGTAGVQDAATLLPDVVVLDVRMPSMTGDIAALQIRQASPGSQIVAFSAHLYQCPEWADGWLDKSAVGRLPQLIQSLAERS